MSLNSLDNAILYKSAEGYRLSMEMYDRWCSHITVSYESRYVETPAGITHILAAGPSDAPPVFLWHGMNASGPMWVAQINDLAKHYRVYAPDIIGAMGRSAPVRLERRTAAYGEWASDVLMALGIERAHHIGISFGGWLILKLSTAAPQKVTSAILMSSAGFVSPAWTLIFKMGPRLFLMPVKRSADERAHLFLDVIGAPGKNRIQQDVEMIGMMLMHFKYEQAPRPCTDDEIRRLTAPTYVLYGEYETGFSPKAAIARAKLLLPNIAKAEIMPGVGHGMITEDVAGVNQRLLSFLNSQ